MATLKCLLVAIMALDAIGGAITFVAACESSELITIGGAVTREISRSQLDASDEPTLADTVASSCANFVHPPCCCNASTRRSSNDRAIATSLAVLQEHFSHASRCTSRISLLAVNRVVECEVLVSYDGHHPTLFRTYNGGTMPFELGQWTVVNLLVAVDNKHISYDVSFYASSPHIHARNVRWGKPYTGESSSTRHLSSTTVLALQADHEHQSSPLVTSETTFSVDIFNLNIWNTNGKWYTRARRIVELIRRHAKDILTFQEVRIDSEWSCDAMLKDHVDDDKMCFTSQTEHLSRLLHAAGLKMSYTYRAAMSYFSLDYGRISYQLEGPVVGRLSSIPAWTSKSFMLERFPDDEEDFHQRVLLCVAMQVPLGQLAIESSLARRLQ